MDQMISTAAVLAPIVFALVQVAKMVGAPSRWAPLYAIASGLITAWLVAWSDAVGELDTGKPGYVCLVGLIAGLAAGGVYSGIRSLAGQPATN